MGKVKDMNGFKTGKCTVLEYAGLSSDKKALWKCLCEYGNLFTATGKLLRSGSVVSCGCYRLSVLKKQGSLNKRHGDAGLVDSRLYRIWHGMKKRCNARNNREAKNYGDKGISYAKEWENYEKFKSWALLNGYDDSLTLDRIDCKGNYTPINCRWATMQIQQNNRSNTVFVEYKGKLKARAMLAKELGVSNQALFYRVRHGIPLDAPYKKQTQTKEDLNKE